MSRFCVLDEANGMRSQQFKTYATPMCASAPRLPRYREGGAPGRVSSAHPSVGISPSACRDVCDTAPCRRRWASLGSPGRGQGATNVEPVQYAIRVGHRLTRRKTQLSQSSMRRGLWRGTVSRALRVRAAATRRRMRCRFPFAVLSVWREPAAAHCHDGAVAEPERAQLEPVQVLSAQRVRSKGHNDETVPARARTGGGRGPRESRGTPSRRHPRRPRARPAAAARRAESPTQGPPAATFARPRARPSA